MSILQKLTENVSRHDLAREGHALLSKWEKTGLLEGLSSEHRRSGMALLLENQAKELLREASSMSAGDVEGFAAVAFPIVRRVFGGLIANELVSVQPMSLPSGLIFFLDFTFTDDKENAGAVSGASIYGGGKVGSQLTGGISLSGVNMGHEVWDLETSAYSLNNGYTSPTSSTAVAVTFQASRSGSGTWGIVGGTGDAKYAALGDALILNDPDLSGSAIGVYSISKSLLTQFDQGSHNYITIKTTATGSLATCAQVRRLTREDPLSGSNRLLIVLADYASGSVSAFNAAAFAQMDGASKTFTYQANDAFTAATALGAVVGTTPWGLEGTDLLAGGTGYNVDIPEIDIKVDSVAVVAVTKKLKAKWTPELAQDLNAYHNLDAEVELTSILSEQIALEIDQEILQDLVKGATAGTMYWSRNPGKFVRRSDGYDITSDGTTLPSFTGNVSEWYETLIETINDVSAQIHRKTLRGGANFIVVSPEVANILEFTSGFRASVTHDDDKGTVGAVQTGSINKKWDVYVDPYFPRNVVLVGRKGSSFLESGYVYAPYVPLQVTPTIFRPEDFTPTKGVMCRYAKKMVRPDMYGLVIVADLLPE